MAVSASDSAWMSSTGVLEKKLTLPERVKNFWPKATDCKPTNARAMDMAERV
jgi:hypothetical protein